jgi:hypothetical protein
MYSYTSSDLLYELGFYSYGNNYYEIRNIQLAKYYESKPLIGHSPNDGYQNLTIQNNQEFIYYEFFLYDSLAHLNVTGFNGISNITLVNHNISHVPTPKFGGNRVNITGLNLLWVYFEYGNSGTSPHLSMRRVQTIDLESYRLESIENRQTPETLTFDREIETILITDFAGNELIRREITYSKYIDLQLDVVELVLFNFDRNKTVYFSFFTRNANITYSVPSNTGIIARIIANDYDYIIYDEDDNMLHIDTISISPVTKKTVNWSYYSEIPTGIIDEGGLWELFLITLQFAWSWLTTDPLGIGLFTLFWIIVGIYAFLWIRRFLNNRREKAEKTRREKKKLLDSYRNKYRGK